MEDTLSSSSSIAKTKPIIALDCDGVLLDDHATFPRIYEKAFRQQVTLVSPKAFRVSELNAFLNRSVGFADRVRMFTV